MSLESFTQTRQVPGARALWNPPGLRSSADRDGRSLLAARPALLDASFATSLLGRHRLSAQVDALRQPMADALVLMADALHRGGRLIFFGNGLSGRVARMVADAIAVAVPACQSRRPMSATALALAGAESAHGSFAHGIHLRGRRGDCAVALSASGRSPNILSAMLAAHDLGMVNIALLGQAGQAIALADVALVCPHSEPTRVHEVQLVIGHTLCRQLARALQQQPA